jgi:AcrR family transcriptional regulator
MQLSVNDRSDIETPLFSGTRGRILETAQRLFAARGFEGTSMRELAKLVELQPSAIYVHFPSKEHLLAELARVGHEMHHAALREALLEAGSDPVSQIRALVSANARMHARHPQLAIVVNDVMNARKGELAEPAGVLRKQSAALLLDVLRRGVKKGCFDVPNIEVVAAAIGAMGLRIPYWYSSDSSLSVEDLAATQAELVLRMLGARG